MQFIGGIAVILTLNVNFGIVLVISLPVQLIAVAIIMKKASPLFSIVQSRLDKVNSVVQENVSGARVVKAFTREEYEINRFDNANTDLMTTNLKVQKLLATLNPILMIIMNASVIAIIMIGGFQVEAKGNAGRRSNGGSNLYNTDTYVGYDGGYDVSAGFTFCSINEACKRSAFNKPCYK